MLSHEVKNYVLLADDGTLELRGVAFRSRRIEPFAAQFLRAVLLALLSGDVPGVRGAFLDTVAALEARALPTAAVATPVRLTKTPAAYAAGRAAHRAAPYEALLSLGRSWDVGERGRVYRRQDRAPAWLPRDLPPDPPDPRDYAIQYYVELLHTTYAGRFRTTFAPTDWDVIFRRAGQLCFLTRGSTQFSRAPLRSRRRTRRAESVAPHCWAAAWRDTASALPWRSRSLAAVECIEGAGRAIGRGIAGRGAATTRRSTSYAAIPPSTVASASGFDRNAEWLVSRGITRRQGVSSYIRRWVAGEIA